MKMCILTQLEESAVGLRESPVIGECDFMPTVDRKFRMVAPPLKDGDYRYIATSEVEAIKAKVFTKDRATYIFDTKNTRYRLEVIR